MMPVPKRQKYGRLFAALAVSLLILLAAYYFIFSSRQTVLRISDWETGEVYIERPVLPGDELFFGWMHSLDQFPWNEYFRIDENLNLILDTISFTAFGAGVPHNKGRVRIKNGIIYMSEINQKFTEIVWINSPATQEIRVAGELVTRGTELPHDRRLVLAVERRNFFGN